jgi:thioredoxin reductase
MSADSNAPTWHDALIIGAGPAGLNAALILGRCRRRVLVLDSGKPRNAASQGLHGFLSRDGTHPMRLRELGREQMRPYNTVEFRDLPVTGVEPLEGGFTVRLSDNSVEHARLLLLATGRVDLMPEVPGFREFYGRGIYHCPHCDGWEHREMPLAIYGRDESAASLALGLLTWSRELTLCADGEPEWSERTAADLQSQGISVLTDRIVRADGGERVERLVFDGRDPLDIAAVFFCSDCVQKSTLPEKLGCSFDDQGNVRCDGSAATNVPGLFVAGNVRGGIHLAIMAAAEGAEAGIAMNNRLLDLDLKSGRFKLANEATPSR